MTTGRINQIAIHEISTLQEATEVLSNR